MPLPAGRPEIGPVAGIAAGAIGGLLFLGLWLLLELPVLPALLVGAVGYAAALLALRRPRRETVISIPGLSRETIATALKEGEARIGGLASLSPRIPAGPIRQKLDAIVAVSGNILDDLRKNPKDIRAARQFLNYYLDATIKIVTTYVELAGKNLESSDIQASLRKAETMLDTIRAAFEKQHARLLEDDVLDLDAEMSLLRKTIAMEGLGDEGGKP